MSGRPPELHEFTFARWAGDLAALQKGDLAAAHPGMVLIKGIATSQHRDLDGEIVHTDGLTWTDPCFLTLEHPRRVDNIIEQVLERRRVEMPDGTPAVEVIGGLYKSEPMAMRVYDKACTIVKSGGDCPFGFSIEGPKEGLVREPGHLLKGTVTSVAVTMGPRNQRAMWAPLMKGLLSGDGRAFELVAELGLTPDDLMRAAVLKRRNDRAWDVAGASLRKSYARTARLGAHA